jgi:RNA polymerase sigma-70 factor (ECF subfamily)
MMRVTRIGARNDVDVLRVEGRLTHETAEELRMACDPVLEAQRSLELDVSGVKFVDDAGVAVLHALEQRGTRLAGCSGFVREMLSDAQRAAPAHDPRRTSHPSPDAALLARLRADDPDAFELLVQQYGGRMLATARRLVRNEDEAHDVVQEAFLSAFRAIDGFAGTAMLSTWLHRIVVNAALMRLRTRRRRREEPIDGLLPTFDGDGHWAEPVSRWATSADELLERRETRAIVREAIDELPVSYRTVLVLRDIEELDTDEAAAILRVTPNAVRTRLHRARQALRTLLDRRFAKRPAALQSIVGG